MEKSWLLVLGILLTFTGNAQNRTFNFEEPDYKVPTLKQGESPKLTSADNKRKRALRLNVALQQPGILNLKDTLILNLFEDKNFKAIVENQDIDTNGTYTIVGRIEESEYAYFFMSTTPSGSYLTVEVPEEDKFYNTEFNHETGQYQLVEANYSDLEMVENVPSEEIPEEAYQKPKLNYGNDINDEESLHDGVLLLEDEPVVLEDPTVRDTITLMIVYTQAAAAWSAQYQTSIQNTIALTMARSKLALDNSNTLITLKLVHTAQVDYTELHNNNDLYNLRNNNDGFMDEVHTLRDRYAADVVALLENTTFTGGLGFLLNSQYGSSSYAFSLTSVLWAANSYILIHEIGHNMGAHHHKEQNYQPGPGLHTYSAGWRWTGGDNGKYCTVMTYEQGQYFSDGIRHYRVPHFSNPSISYQGSTGHSTNGDNARTFREIKRVISNYRSGNNDVNDPISFAASPASSTQLDISWAKNPSGHPVMLAFSTSPSFGTPTSGTSYSAGASIPGGGTVLYNGSANLFNHSGIYGNINYYYKAWSVMPGSTYSTGVTTSGVTVCSETLSVSPSSASIGHEEASTTLLSLTSNTNWSISSNETWLTANPVSGSGNRNITLTANANPDHSTRTATLTFSANCKAPVTLIVTQEAKPVIVVAENYNVSDTIIYSFTEACFNATNSLVLGGIENEQVVIQENATVTIIAAQSIRFLPGFHAQLGSNVHAWITTDNTFCPGQTVPRDPMVSNNEKSQGLEPETSKQNPVYLNKKDVKIYPNPSKGLITLESSQLDGISEIVITNLSGANIRKTTWDHSNKLFLDISTLQSGLYLVHIKNGDDYLVKKIILN
jgi:hypothetical protein